MIKNYMAFEDTCPHCGSHLILREGQYGEFMACPRFPGCRYTKPIYDDEHSKEYIPPSPFCKKCNHTGLIPFIKNEKIIPFAWINCECKREIGSNFPTSVEDFDFPCSYDWRRFYSQERGEYLPPLEPVFHESKPPKVIPQKIIVKHHYMEATKKKYATYTIN